jgi:hypothetical protein
MQITDPGADGLDAAGGFEPETVRQLQRIEATTMIDVDVVETDRLVTHTRLPGRRVADLKLLPAHDFGAPGLVHTNGKRHDYLLLWFKATV